MSYFFKIIVSNYNNKKYIEKCINSILIQKFKDFQIIIVDDISTDGSDEICSRFAEQYPDKIQFIRLAEKGYAGKCRNTGLAINIDSKYTYIIDGDDWLHNENTLQNIYNIAIKHDPDLIRCSYDEYRGPDKIKLVKLNSDFTQIIKGGAAPWKNCFKSSFDHIRFIEQRSKCNDVVWFLRLCDSIDDKKIAAVQYPCNIYNKISVGSCWHGKIKHSKHCRESSIMLAYDLEHESFKKKPIIEKSKQIIKNKKAMFKDWKTIFKKYEQH